jgi:RHS repeat-associated protein
LRYLYQNKIDIGAYNADQLVELRILGKSAFGHEIGATVAIELQGIPYAPISDHRGNISTLRNLDGTSYETYHYSPFGEEQIFDASGNLQTESLNPWRYASKRKDTGLINFGRRVYDPQIGRWLTADPAGFIDGMNLYQFNFNNPFRYIDKDGRFAFLLVPLVVSFGLETVVTTTTLYAIGGTLAGAALGWGVYEGFKYLDQHLNASSHAPSLSSEAVAEDGTKKKGRRRGKDNESKGGPPKDKANGNYLPDPAAEGTDHTTLGKRKGSSGNLYTQGATFDKDGEFKGRTDVTNHERMDHPKPHFHPAIGPNSVDSGPFPLPFDLPDLI